MDTGNSLDACGAGRDLRALLGQNCGDSSILDPSGLRSTANLPKLKQPW
jgi:hypothetical protein